MRESLALLRDDRGEDRRDHAFEVFTILGDPENIFVGPHDDDAGAKGRIQSSSSVSSSRRHCTGAGKSALGVLLIKTILPPMRRHRAAASPPSQSSVRGSTLTIAK